MYDTFSQKSNTDQEQNEHSANNMFLRPSSALSINKPSQILVDLFSLNKNALFTKNNNNDKSNEKQISFNLSTCSEMETMSTSKTNFLALHIAT